MKTVEQEVKKIVAEVKWTDATKINLETELVKCVDANKLALGTIRDKIDLFVSAIANTIVITDIAYEIRNRFNLKGISYEELCKWKTVGDVVKYAQKNYTIF